MLLLASEIILPPAYNTPPPAEIKARRRLLLDEDRLAPTVQVERHGQGWRVVDGLRTVLAARSVRNDPPVLDCREVHAIQCLRIRGWWPTLLNAALRMHHHKRNRLYHADYFTIAAAQSVARLRPATGRRTLHLTVEVGTRRPKPPDPDALYKPLLDGLVLCGLLLSDDWKGVRLTGVDFRMAQKNGVAVLLEDVPPSPWFNIGGGVCKHNDGGRGRKRK